MDLLVIRPSNRLRSGLAAVVLAALVAAVTLVIAAPAQAHARRHARVKRTVRAAQAHEPWGAKAWGSGESGQLGNGATSSSSLPVAVSTLSGVTALAGNESDSYALLEDGTVMAWGAAGSLGDGTETSSAVPVGVCEIHYSGPGPCPSAHYLKGVTAIAAGENHAVALLEDGTVVDWGEQAFADLGDGVFKEGETSTERSPVPVGVCEIGYSEPGRCSSEHYLKGAKAIAAGGRASLAVFGSNDEVAAWGESALNNGSIFGAGTKKMSYNVPVAVCAVNEKAPCAKNLTGATAVALGQGEGLALLEGGKVVDWGEGRDGALGNGKTEGAEAPVEVQGLSEEVTAIAGGSRFGLALLKGGGIEAWGSNEDGLLGDGMMIPPGPERCGEFKETPCSTKATAAASGLKGVTAIAAGREHALALLRGGTVKAWGVNSSGQLGNGEEQGPERCGVFATACSQRPVEAKLGDVKGIAAGERHSLAFGPPPPVVAALSPEQGKTTGGANVTITGADFEEASEVKFGSVKAASFQVNSQSSITAISPPGKGIVDVTVTTPAGTSAVVPTDRFYYQRPTIKKLSPRKGPELGGISVTITGANLGGATAVKFGSNSATSFKVNSETSITAVSPSHPFGTVDVSVTTPNGTSAITKKDRFKYR
jgi:alpha-tubulin suppressor-like RCC1 family protein